MRLILQNLFYTHTCSSLAWLHRTFYLRRTLILFYTNKSNKKYTEKENNVQNVRNAPQDI